MMPPRGGMKRSFLGAFIVGGLILAAETGTAQTVAVDSIPCSVSVGGSTIPAPAAGPARAPVVADSGKAPAAVMLFAAASAREVTFSRTPEIRVRLCGGLDSLRVIERRNLPSPVVAGRTYRDVYVAVEIFARLNADCVVAALTSGAADSTGRRNACASLEIGGTRTRPPND